MNDFSKLLLVEDDPNLGLVTLESLELHGFSVTLSENGDSAYSEFLNGRFDLCLIDIMLPQKDGFTLAHEIRQVNPEIPIIFLTAKSLKEDRIEGFKAGCDDYITKPFSIEELVLRIQAVLRRSYPAMRECEKQLFQIGTYSFDYIQQCLIQGNNLHNLTNKESELLRLLCLHRNQILDREVTLKLVWGDDNIFTSRSMDVYITKLRKYLKKDPNIQINNIHGKGFKLKIMNEKV